MFTMKTLRLQLRFLVPLLLTLTVAALVALPLMDRLTLRWFARDLNTRDALVANTLSDAINEAQADGKSWRIQSLFDRAVQDERLVAIALCGPGGEMLRRTEGYPKDLGCDKARGLADQAVPRLLLDTGSVHIGVQKLKGEGGSEEAQGASLVMLHDMSFI